MIAGEVALWGFIAGLIHFVVLGALYGNPVVDRMYVRAGETSPAVRTWESKPRYLLTQFVGTQVEVYIIAIGFAWLHPQLSTGGLAGALLLASLFAALRVFPRFWKHVDPEHIPGEPPGHGGRQRAHRDLRHRYGTPPCAAMMPDA